MEPGTIIALVGVVVAIVVAAGGVATWLLMRGGREASYIAQAKNAENLAIAATANYNLLLDRLHTHETKSAVLFERLEGLTQSTSAATITSENRLSKSIDELKDTMKDFINRFDQALTQIRERDHRDREK